MPDLAEVQQLLYTLERRLFAFLDNGRQPLSN